MKTALLLCVIAAVGYGVGAVLQAVGARQAAAKGGTNSEGFVTMVTQPIFLFGLLVDFASWVISRFALHTLPLFAVQTILAGSLAVTVLLARIVLGTQLRRADQWAIGATILGLVLVGVSAGESEAKELSHLLKVIILLGIPATLLVGLALIRLSKSILLAVLAGGAFTASALSARAVHIKDQSFTGILSEPLLWAVLIYAILALGLHAAALQRGQVGPVTAAMWATEVLVATVVGAIALGDHMRDNWQIPALLGVALTLGATIVLARAPGQDLDHREIVTSSATPASDAV